MFGANEFKIVKVYYNYCKLNYSSEYDDLRCNNWISIMQTDAKNETITYNY